jgi:mannonate dehydratase
MRPGFNMGVDTIEYNSYGVSDDSLAFAAQFGVKDLIVQSYVDGVVPGETKWEYEDIVELKNKVESFGLRINALENVPIRFYDHIMLNGPKRDEQIENMIYTIKNIAKAGIRIFGYHWMPSRVWRTGRSSKIRGGALVTSFDYSIVESGVKSGDEVDGKPPMSHDRIYEDDEMWESLEYWIKIITPIAEEEGIRLGIHPCDPPVPKLGGTAQLFRSFDAYKRLIEIYPSDSNAIEFCQGTFSEMQGEDIYEMIRYFGERKKILYVHFRNVSSQVPKFNEEFINTGYVDMYKAMEIYHQVGFDGVFVDDHVPLVVDDSSWGHRGRAFANGYIQATIEAVKRNAR